LIGVPVAATPGFLPQAEVPDAAGLLAAGLLAAGLLAAALVAGALLELLLLLLLLLLHAARTPIASTATATPASRERRCSDSFMGSAFSWLTAKFFPNGPVRSQRVRLATPGGQTKNTSFKRETVRLCTAFALRAM
jgi:hypothetical protein